MADGKLIHHFPGGSFEDKVAKELGSIHNMSRLFLAQLSAHPLSLGSTFAPFDLEHWTKNRSDRALSLGHDRQFATMNWHGACSRKPRLRLQTLTPLATALKIKPEDLVSDYVATRQRIDVTMQRPSPDDGLRVPGGNVC